MRWGRRIRMGGGCSTPREQGGWAGARGAVSPDDGRLPEDRRSRPHRRASGVGPADREPQWGPCLTGTGLGLGRRNVLEVVVVTAAQGRGCACCPRTGHSRTAKMVNSMLCICVCFTIITKTIRRETLPKPTPCPEPEDLRSATPPPRLLAVPVLSPWGRPHADMRRGGV